jgi:lipoprotein Spr/probable lipoprotein NlpC
MRGVVLLLAIMLASCANFQSVESTHSGVRVADTSRPTSSNSEVSSKLKQVYQTYKGSPYKYGGTDRNGFDCSGFIGVAYQDAFELSLPRTTTKLASSGKPIRRDQLKAGDIIIFKTSVKQLHAGIYTGNDRFIHASTSKGVIESSLANDYWRQRYVKARRYL